MSVVDVLRERHRCERPRGLQSAARYAKTVLAATLGFLTTGNAGVALAAHPFHTTAAQAEMNLNTGKLEVALRVFPDDLEHALARRAHKQVSLEKTPNVDKLILEYLKTVFIVRPAPFLEATSEPRTSVRAAVRKPTTHRNSRGDDTANESASPDDCRVEGSKVDRLVSHPAPMRWIGKEVLIKSAWLYFEVALPKGLDQTQVSNGIFFETQSKQINTVVFKQGKFTTSVQFAVKAPTVLIAIPASK